MPIPSCVSAWLSFWLAIGCTTGLLAAEVATELDGRLHHLRSGNRREWADFPQQAEGSSVTVPFQAPAPSEFWCLRYRQQDVKQAWRLRINQHEVTRLIVNENDMLVYVEIPSAAIRQGENTIVVEPVSPDTVPADDIRVGEMALFRSRRANVLREASLELAVQDEYGAALPCRLTIHREEGPLQSVLAEPAEELAVRPGVVYAARGRARLHLPAGEYRVTAGRGFEYSQSKQHVLLADGDTRSLSLRLDREVATPGFVACDTHVHTRTHSGHGDATVEERMITLAGEAIELPIATDHNVHVDHHPFATAVGVREYFTPVIGNEVTTRKGHFNIFPVEPGSPIPNFRLDDYAEILASIYQTPGVKVAILNHARDVHSGVTPFGPSFHNAVVGENTAGWHLGFNAMEVINSSATQTKPLQLIHDWLAILNSGRRVTPVGSSDSHDVGRHFVGQGRTYIRCDDKDPSRIDVEQAVDSFLQGRVLVSYGLLVELTVNEKYGCGEIVLAPSDSLRLQARVLGPSWAAASRLIIYSNGRPLRQFDIDSGERVETGLISEHHWLMDRPEHDVHLVAVAVGPSIDDLAWPTAKPYQPTSPVWEATTLACSGPIWVDVDQDGRRTSARDYARRVLAAHPSPIDPAQLVAVLGEYDAAVAAQAAHLLHQRGLDLLSDHWQAAVGEAVTDVQAGFREYLAAWRESELRRMTDDR